VTTVQLRRYQLEPGRTADFLAWFPTIVPVREQYGFRVSSALVDATNDTFTWTVEHDGDESTFTDAERVYNASPERAAAFETFPHCVAVMELGFVTDVLASR
jgi:antibiotic biosynthesis monooxygenase (ABM) superfamily enzyme